MMDRRTILSGTSASLIAAAYNANNAHADEVIDVKIDPASLSPEYIKRHTVRFPKLDEDSYLNFIEGAKIWHSKGTRGPEYTQHIESFLKSKGTSMLDDTPLTNEQAFDLMHQDPLYAARTRIQWTLQDLMWDRTVRFFHKNADIYYKAMEATDKAGPGKLELNTSIKAPEYTLHEIHRQPGGYVGDPFGGWAYHWALSQAFYMGRRHDEIHIALAQSHPVPASGASRILDIGCSSGMTTTAYKERFPDAEVWGLDVGGPMVRYAHHRAIKMGLDCNFRQALAEDTGFPDNHFDMIHDFFLFHEVSRAGAEDIVKEMFRVMKPGGSWKHNDIVTEGNPLAPPSKTVLGKAAAWNSLRGNYEPWWLECMNADFPAMLRNAGFKVELAGASANGYFGQPLVIATKPA